MSYIRKTFYANRREWGLAHKKANRLGYSLAHAIRQLLKMWIDDEVEVQAPEDEE